MQIECEGIVLRQTRILKGRRMVTLLTGSHGKLSCGTNISERGMGGTALAVRPFARGHYRIHARRRGTTYYNLMGGDIEKSYFGIGEDYDRFAAASLALEFTERTLIEEAPVPEVFALLACFLDLMEVRVQAHRTLSVAYVLKLLQHQGVFPDRENFGTDELLSGLDLDIMNQLVFMMEEPLSRMASLALDEAAALRLQRVLLRFAERHLDIGPLKSDLPGHY
ncbi:MAG: DNA repair protein RecO [Clostridiales Family XIII bacterium]|jgi:hypothetical protein|nr:DNA repair protein RecO [Clostridiales Family XIII bacterium]